MSETTPPDEPPMSREQKLKARQENERIKLLSSLSHSIALAIFGIVALRLLLDPSAQPPAPGAIVVAVIIAVALEGAAFYILGLLKAES